MTQVSYLPKSYSLERILPYKAVDIDNGRLFLERLFVDVPVQSDEDDEKLYLDILFADDIKQVHQDYESENMHLDVLFAENILSIKEPIEDVLHNLQIEILFPELQDQISSSKNPLLQHLHRAISTENMLSSIMESFFEPYNAATLGTFSHFASYESLSLVSINNDSLQQVRNAKCIHKLWIMTGSEPCMQNCL